MKWGTSYFVSVPAAVRYYRAYEHDNAEQAVALKIADGNIHIGQPSLEPWQVLSIIYDGTRYAIEEPEVRRG